VSITFSLLFEPELLSSGATDGRAFKWKHYSQVLQFVVTPKSIS